MKSWILVLGCVFAATLGAAPVTPVAKGQMLMSANGARLGVVYRVNADGSPQIIVDGKLITIPAATLSSTNGKLVTNLSKSAVSELR
jgi:hypothetical protein